MCINTACYKNNCTVGFHFFICIKTGSYKQENVNIISIMMVELMATLLTFTLPKFL